MKKLIGVTVFLLRLSILFSQEDFTFLDLNEFGGKKIPTSLLSKISIHLEKAPFETALTSIAEKSQIKLNYGRDQIPLHKKISIHKDNIYAMEALLTVLKNTGTMLKITQEGQLAIVPQKESKEDKSGGSRGTIRGTVKDSKTGEPLPGANVILKGTALGAASDLKGRYLIPSVPPGSYALRFSYIGFQEYDVDIQVKPGETLTVDADLVFKILKGEVVTVTAQLVGQAAAINQQINSNIIKNVVSAERINELPDANAAESVGRLPGISIIRSGGEGNSVVIRGLSPGYNLITINGERMPTGNLSMISSEILAGIEVTKSLTPDQDPAVFGGTVNFTLADAPGGGFRYNFRFREGYNAQRQEAGQYKGSFILSNRYWNEKFGLMVSGNIERVQRGSDRLSANYIVVREKREGETVAPISADNVSLSFVDEMRKRFGFSVLMDYRLPNGNIMFSNFMSRLDTDGKRIRNIFRAESNWHQRDFRDQQEQTDILTNSMTGEHKLKFGTLNWRFSRTASLTRVPFNNSISFLEQSAFDQTRLPNFFGPHELINAAYNNLDNTGLYSGDFTTNKSSVRDYAGQLNLQIPYTMTSNIAGFIKFGGKYFYHSSDNEYGEARERLDRPSKGLERHHTQFGTPGFEYQRLPTGWPSIYNYLDANFDAGNFLDGEYDFGPGLNGNELNHLLTTFLVDSFYTISSMADLDDNASVTKESAGYIMTELNFGRFLMLLPGVRYEYTTAKITARKGNVPSSEFEPKLDQPYVTDTTATTTYGCWFPMFNTRLRPTSWFDIRLAYTKSFKRPPLGCAKKVNGSAQSVEFGRMDLKPQISKNYDIFLSFYSNDIGLFTLGGFYKEIDDLILNRQGHKILNAKKEGFPKELQGLTLSRPENSPFPTKVKGWEVEWQTNFNWLPSPFDGIVLNANYSHIWSETQFPRSFVTQKKIPVFPFVYTVVVDSFRVGSMPNQSDDIANVAIGYDKGPFSARLSMLYQGKTLSSVGERPELDGFTADLLRMDLSVKYKLMKYIVLFFNWNNITNEPDESFQQQTRYPTDREFYSWTADFGIGYAF